MFIKVIGHPRPLDSARFAELVVLFLVKWKKRIGNGFAPTPELASSFASRRCSGEFFIGAAREVVFLQAPEGDARFRRLRLL